MKLVSRYTSGLLFTFHSLVVFYTPLQFNRTAARRADGLIRARLNGLPAKALERVNRCIPHEHNTTVLRRDLCWAHSGLFFDQTEKGARPCVVVFQQLDNVVNEGLRL